MEDKEKIWHKKAPVTIIGVLAIGIICSALYDIFIRPGINIFSSKLFDLATLGSQSIKDYAFSNAALDPTSLPSAFLLFAFSGGLTGVLMAKGTFRFKRSIRSQQIPLKDRKLRRLITPIISLLCIVFIFVSITVTNQSILIWRSFNANTKIIAPYTNEKDLLIISSKFSSMTTEAEYNEIYKTVSTIAESNNLRLRDTKTW
ncbi:hypothetical protein [Pseudomonas benzopyrenica]|uniref:hypothetical protein n=1 Tax=Pseudomonas benzopyrenica TaxID=2993566 RepID=UPI003F1553ED